MKGKISTVAVAPAVTVVKSVEKNVVVPAPLLPVSPQAAAQANINTNATVGERLYYSLKKFFK